jgi:hypothetical protein
LSLAIGALIAILLFLLLLLWAASSGGLPVKHTSDSKIVARFYSWTHPYQAIIRVSFVLATGAALCLFIYSSLAHNNATKQDLAPITAVTPAAAAAHTPTIDASPIDVSGKPVGVWIQADPKTAVQLQIADWKTASTDVVLYITTGHAPFRVIYKGQGSQRTRSITTFTVVEDSSTRLPKSYNWCRRITGTIRSATRQGEEYLDIAPVCTDGTGPGIINHRGGGPINGTIPRFLIDSGSHVMHLSSTAG